MNKNIIIAEGMGKKVIGEALCSPDYETGALTVDPWQVKSDRTMLWPVYVANCACDSEVYMESQPSRSLAHYVYCLEPIPDYENDVYACMELMEKLRIDIEHMDCKAFSGVEATIEIKGFCTYGRGKTLNEAVYNVVYEYFNNDKA